MILEPFIVQLQERVGEEWDAWRASPEGKPRPNHEQEWEAIRLLIFANHHGTFGYLSRRQFDLVRKFAKVPQKLGAYCPQDVNPTTLKKIRRREAA